MTAEELKKHNAITLHKAALAKAEPIKLSELEEAFKKWMILPDLKVLKLLAAFYCANKLSRKAIWLMLIGPSGGGKTELLNALLDLPDIEPISQVTPNTFLSGMPGKADASLLPKLTNRIMLMKDFTTILSMQRDAKSEIYAQLREIWDGSMKKIFGNGKIATWEGKVSLLAASTQAVDIQQQQMTHLGERFINYRLVMPDRKEVAMRALNNDNDMENMQNELRIAFFSFIKGIDLTNTKLAQLPEGDKKALVDLANFATMARSGVIREMGMKKEVIFVPTAEMPTRIAGQLNALASGLVIVNGGMFMPEDMEILYKVMLDSIPQTNKMVAQEMAKADNQTTSEIATALGYPTEPIRMYLENLALLKVCDRVKESGRGDRWTLKPEFGAILRHYEQIEELTDQERSDRTAAALGVDGPDQQPNDLNYGWDEEPN